MRYELIRRAKDFIAEQVFLKRIRNNSSVKNNPDFLLLRPELEKIYKNVWRWHGTGRYRYGTDGVIDVLQSIIHQGGLVPQYDIWDPKAVERHTISTSRSRMYSRVYAQMHLEEGNTLVNEFGAAKAWLMYFLGYATIKFIAEYHPDLRVLLEPESPEKWNKVFPDQDQLKQDWAKKVTQKAIPFFDIFEGHSDIPENYPILFGIENCGYEPVHTSVCLMTHEQRYSEPIPLSKLTHLEVPGNKIAETAHILEASSLNIPVFPIECGEQISSSLTFSQLEGMSPIQVG